MTRKQKAALATSLMQQAGNLVEFWSAHQGEADELAGLTADDVAEQLGMWLKDLPGDAWDTRLVDPRAPKASKAA